MQLDLYSSAPTAGQPQPLSRFLTQRKVFIKIDDATEYKRCRVQSNRKGVVMRDLAKGAAINTKKQQLCRPGDFLVAEIDAKVGGYGFVPGELDGAIVSSHYYLFEVDEAQLLPRYLHYLTQSDIIQSQIISQGSTNYAAIRPKEFLAIEIPYVEPGQQREIVARLDAVTQEAEAFNLESTHQATLLTNLRQAILREAVQARLLPQDHTDEPAYALLARIRAEKQRLIKEKVLRAEKPLPPLSKADVPYEVPEGWVWCRLGDVCRFIDYRGKTPTKTTIGIRLITAKNIKLGYLSEEPKEYIAEDAYDSWMTRGLPEIGDVLFTTEAPLGNVAQLSLSQKIALAQRTILLRPFSNWNKELLKFILLSSPVRSLIFAKSSGMTAEGIKSSFLKQIPIPLPPLAEQRRIVAKVAELLAYCTEMEAEMGRAQATASALHAAALREAFTEPAVSAAKAEL